MTRTPWGDSEGLRERRLKPGPGHDRETVLANQRERLLGGMVAALAEKGYPRATVADVVRISGVSRADYYKHFANFEECYLATFDAIVEQAMAVIEKVAAEHEGEAAEQAVLETLFGLVVEQPAAARVCLIEVYPAGAEAVARAERAAARFQELLRETFDRAPETERMPEPLLRAIIGGVHKILYTRLRTGDEAELPGMVDQVRQWIGSYPAPPGPLDKRIPEPPKPLAVPPIDGSEEQRLMAATAVLARDKSYDGLTVTEIGKVASMSYTTFYEHFKDKEEAFLATYDLAAEQAFGAAHEPYESEDDWVEAMTQSLQAFHEFISTNTALTHVALVEVLSAGPRALERRDDRIDFFTHFLEPGYERAPQLPPVAGEAIGGGICALWYDHIRRRGANRLGELLPTVTYFVLAPFVGADEAMAHAKPARSAA